MHGRVLRVSILFCWGFEDGLMGKVWFSTCMDDSLDLDAGDVQLFCKGMNRLEQIFTRLWVNVRPSGWDFN